MKFGVDSKKFVGKKKREEKREDGVFFWGIGFVGGGFTHVL